VHTGGVQEVLRPDTFIAHVLRNPGVAAILERWPTLALPDCWLVAGCLFQTVWNLRSGINPQDGIRDYDLFYFDDRDRSGDAEHLVQSQVEARLDGLGLLVEATNQARVHLWYADHFGHPYPALRDSRDGIDRFLVRETCVGIRPNGAGGYEVYAPYGLQGIADGTLTPNALTPHRNLFDAKAASYQARWPWLRIIS
jgi:hypothetical protein